MQFASPIKYIGDSSAVYKPLAWTSKVSGKFSAPISFNMGRQWHSFDFLYPKQTVAALLEGPLASEQHSRLVLVGDGNFMVNGVEGNMIKIQPDNIHFMVNAVDWLTDDTGLLELRTKGITSRPLKKMNDNKIFWIKYFNFLFPILAIILYGLIRFQRRRILRGRRMRMGYRG